MAKRMSFSVTGKVQGVFFRDYTQQKANSYGLTGFVKNTSDGKVAGEAQGDESSLEKFKKDLNSGPSAAQVSNVETNDISTKDGESSFES